MPESTERPTGPAAVEPDERSSLPSDASRRSPVVHGDRPYSVATHDAQGGGIASGRVVEDDLEQLAQACLERKLLDDFRQDEAGTVLVRGAAHFKLSPEGAQAFLRQLLIENGVLVDMRGRP